MAQIGSLVHSGHVDLPVGLWAGGARQCEASLRVMSGRDEERIGDAALWPSPAARASALLASTLERIGAISPVGLEHARALAVLDRDILLVALRQSLFGDRVQSTVACPHPGCGKRVDIDFNLSDLPVPDRPDPAPAYTLALEGREVSFRLPNGGDQEAAALTGGGVAQAAQAILERCVTGLAALSAEQAAALRDEMARRDPQLDTEFDARCPECGEAFLLHFDIQDYLLCEISMARRELFRQVHTLAWYYHWSEAEIMALPYARRQTYLRLLSDAVSEVEEARL